MAKGQKRSNKEVRKPKKESAKPVAQAPMKGILATSKGK
jgi:hypothetical protein